MGGSSIVYLARDIDHPSPVRVYRFRADNGSACMARPYYDGITLKKWLKDLGAPPSGKWPRAIAWPLKQALAVLHEQGCKHRDVAPDNILMVYDRSGGNYLEQVPRPVLLNFGAARRVVADAKQTLTSLLQTGYSPVEQYDNESKLLQGPWTDVYALSAVLYKEPPAEAPLPQTRWWYAAAAAVAAAALGALAAALFGRR